MSVSRKLVVVADDLGIGHETDRGILELACKGVVTATVLLVNSKTASEAVAAWRHAGKPCDLGWHPCLTLDRPILASEQVPSLVDPNGNFWKLGTFLLRWFAGLIRAEEVYSEWLAQLRRFRDLTGADPVLVNTHQHVGIFPGHSEVLLRVLEGLPVRPWVRRVVESQKTRQLMGGARLKRWFLCGYGNKQGKMLDKEGYPGARTMIGLTDPNCLKDDRFFEKCLQYGTGNVVELMCHPGYRDMSLVGRDVCGPGAGLDRRPWELAMLGNPFFANAVAVCNYRLSRPSEWVGKGRLAC